MSISNWLNSIVTDKKNKKNQIDEDIAKLRQGCEDAQKAANGFNEASFGMAALMEEVRICFKGDAAEAFIAKLSTFFSFCASRAICMTATVYGYSSQIASLEEQSKKSQKTIEKLEEWVAKLKKVGL